MCNGHSLDPISDDEYEKIKNLFFDHSGILLKGDKKDLIRSRLQKRLTETKSSSYLAYYKFITKDENRNELEKFVNLLTTNETYFFREMSQFDYLKKFVLKNYPVSSRVRLWSAASSTGEEAYSLAMLLEDQRGHAPWSIVGTDLNTDVLESARKAVYPMSRLEAVPDAYLKKYFLKGKGQYLNQILVEKSLRERVTFESFNLKDEKCFRDIGHFDIIFLRNVMIYFDIKERQQIVHNATKCLHPNGWLFIGLSESLLGINHSLVQKSSSVFQRAKND
ncbi:MAG: CheR family methyltransferase [Bacteriovorax sp.]